MPPETDTLAKMQELVAPLTNPELRKKLYAAVDGEPPHKTSSPNREAHWNRRTVMSYYKEPFAKELQVVLDGMLLDEEDREFRFVDFPRYTKNTLYAKINQSWLYLVDCLDPDKKYVALRQRTEIKTTKTGIRIKFTTPGSEIPLHAVKVEKEVFTHKWKDKFDDFVENGKIGEKLHLTKLSLSEEDIQDLKMSLYSIDSILHRITTSEIKLIKIDPKNKPEGL